MGFCSALNCSGVKRPFVVTLEPSPAISKFSFYDLCWSFVSFIDNHNAMPELVLIKETMSPKRDILLFKPQDLPWTPRNRGWL